MASETTLAATLIGREAIDTQSRHLGWVIAVIHRGNGADVLVEHRRWLRHRSYRFRMSDIGQLDDGRVVVAPQAMWRLGDLDARVRDAAAQRR